MTQSLNPEHMAVGLPAAQLRLALSVHNTINGGIDQAIPTAQEPSSAGINAGVYSQFAQGNLKNQLVRVAASGVSNTNASYNWTTSHTGIVINHSLGRLPIGFKIVDKDKTVDVYRTAAPTTTTITIAPTDATSSVTLEIF
jgi:hypothetical protein